MIRSVALLAPRTARARNSRAIRDEHVAIARERIFGHQDSMPGDRNFRKKLEGKKLMQWYFPSKYGMQDFRVDDYFEMQAERFQPREPHDSRRELTDITRNVSKHRETLRHFFQQLDRQAFLDSPQLQDLYGVFRLVDPDPALPFSVPDLVFKDHGPMFSADAPFQTAGGRAEAGVDDQQLALQALVLQALGGAGREARALELSARLSLLRSQEEVREALLDLAREHNVVPSFERMAVVLEETERGAHDAALPQAGSADASGADPVNIDPGLLAELKGVAQTQEAGADAVAKDAGSGGGADTVKKDFGLLAELKGVAQTQEAGADAVAKDAGSESGADPVKKDLGLSDELTGAAPIQEEDASSLEPAKPLGDAQGSPEESVNLAAPRREQRRRIMGLHAGPLEENILHARKEKAKDESTDEIENILAKGAKPLRAYVKRRHRFMDPMFRRRRLKWLERSLSQAHKEKEIKFNSYYATHPDDSPVFPLNKGSVTVVWPSPYH